MEMELDVTESPAVVTAQRICEFVGKVLASQKEVK